MEAVELPVNQFKQALAEGRLQYGLWLGLPDTTCAEICAGAGFDWLVIDAEHGPFDLRSVLAHLQTIAAYEVSSIVRPVSDDRNLLKQLLDAGVQTLLVPMVESADQAAELVRSVRYPPEGVRGLGTALARAARWNGTPGYLHKANEQICLIVQVETISAVKNLSAILEVEGVDGIFIGPSDLSASMGHVGHASHPEVVEVIGEAIRQINGANKAAGILSIDPSLTQNYIDKGASFIGVGVDTLLLAGSAKQLADSVKNRPNGSSGAGRGKPLAGY